MHGAAFGYYLGLDMQQLNLNSTFHKQIGVFAISTEGIAFKTVTNNQVFLCPLGNGARGLLNWNFIGVFRPHHVRELSTMNFIPFLHQLMILCIFWL